MIKIEATKVSALTGHKDAVYTLDGADDRIFSGAGDGMVASWDLKAPENGLLEVKLPNSVYAIAYLQDSNQMLVGQNFEGVHKIDLNTKKELASAKITTAAVFDIKVANNLVLAASGEGVITVLEREELKTLAKIQVSDKSARTLAVNERAGIFAGGYSDHSVRVFSLKDFTLMKEFPAHQNSVFTLAFSPDGIYLLSGGRDARLNIWLCEEDFRLKESIVAHMYAINHIAYSPDGKYFATCSMDKSIKIWDADEFRLLKVIDKARHTGHATSVNRLYWSAYKNLLVSCSDDRTISLWDLKFSNEV